MTDHLHGIAPLDVLSIRRSTPDDFRQTSDPEEYARRFPAITARGIPLSTEILGDFFSAEILGGLGFDTKGQPS